MAIRKKRNYNSDYMSRMMDEQLEQIEDRLSALYANAAFEVNAEWMAFSKTFAENDAKMRTSMEAGRITDAEYELWRQKQILQTDLYKATVDKMTDTMVKTDIAAIAMVNGEMPLVVAESYNFVQALGWMEAEQAGLSVGTFQVYNADSVQALMRQETNLLKQVNIPEDERWNSEKINQQIATSIMKGEPIDTVADRLQQVTNMDRNAAIRNARTLMTAAENFGRMEAADDLHRKGIPVEEEWSAIHDERTRYTHTLLDGTRRNADGYFGEGIIDTPLRFPADPLGDPEEIYNCRCRASIVLKGIDHSNDDELYEKFMLENDPKSWDAIQERRKADEEAFQKTKKGG